MTVVRTLTHFFRHSLPNILDLNKMGRPAVIRPVLENMQDIKMDVRAMLLSITWSIWRMQTEIL